MVDSFSMWYLPKIGKELWVARERGYRLGSELLSSLHCAARGNLEPCVLSSERAAGVEP